MHIVCRKSIHADCYLNLCPHHSPLQKYAVPSALICAPENPRGKIQHLKNIFRQKYYSASDICKDSSSGQKHICSNTHKLVRVDVAPYVPPVSDTVSVFLMRFNIRSVDIPANKSGYLLRLDKDDLGIEAYAYVYIHTINRAIASSTSP
jgi:hypothetical protein